MDVKHTPTPWALDRMPESTFCIYARYYLIAEVSNFNGRQVNAANAAFIVRAVNNHDALVAALQQCRDELGAIHHAGASVDHAEKHSAGFRLANAALAKATSPD